MLESSPGGSQSVIADTTREKEWPRKRGADEDTKTDVKRPRYNWYFKLESESSISSDEDTESIHSIQNRETDIARDTSDTDTKSESSGSDTTDVEIEVEYDVASLSGDDNPFASSSGSEDVLAAAAGAIAAVICDNSLEAWVTDCEDSDNSSLDDLELSRTDFWTCVQCKSQNNNPLFRFCEKCFQERKMFFPPRPRGHRPRKAEEKRKNATKPTVKLDNLRSCLNGLSQDSGVGSSLEMPLDLDLHKIVVPKHLSESQTSTSSGEGSSQTTTSSESIDTTKLLNNFEQRTSATPKSQSETDSSKSLNEIITDRVLRKSPVKRKCSIDNNSDSVLSDSDDQSRKKRLKTNVETDITHKQIENKIGDDQDKITKIKELNGTAPVNCDKLPEYKELCIICNNSPKNSIFLHGSIAHMCCCYKCAMRTWGTSKRCPVCNGKVRNVVKVFTV